MKTLVSRTASLQY